MRLYIIDVLVLYRHETSTALAIKRLFTFFFPQKIASSTPKLHLP